MKKHPHTCGEDPASVSSTASCRETPPRMWGRLNIGVIEGGKLRNTPTHVGKTLTGTFTRTNTEKHPHACREDQQGFCQYALRQEIPPHMWGRPRHLQISGIQQRKHPHACGEDNIFERAKTASGETPPRMWGRPAAAGYPAFEPRKHPHACGEDQRRQVIQPSNLGNTPTHVGKT